MKNNNAIIILWQGNDIPEYLVDKIQTILLTNGICEGQDLTIVVKDENSIANAILRDTVNKHCNVESDIIRFAKEPESDAIEHAVVYIGGRFEDSLKRTNTMSGLVTFAMNLTAAVTAARNNLEETEHDNALLNAVSIIKKNCTSINYNSTLAKSHHFTKKVVEVICNIHDTCM